MPRLPLPTLVLAALLIAGQSPAGEPPVINPFGRAPAARDDAIAGYVEMSDGSVHPGHIFLTRDKRLKLHDEKRNRQREIPLRAVSRIECSLKKEWMEKEWKFKESASAEKTYTGRTYPAREYAHTITLHDGRTMTGGLSAVVYVRLFAYTPSEPGKYRTAPVTKRFILHKRDKGRIGEKLDSLDYVKLINLGDGALAEGRKKAALQRSEKSK